MKNTLRRIGILTLLVGFVVAPSMGCRKKKDTIVNVYVRDANNNAISGAVVTLFADPSSPNPGTLSEKWEDLVTTSNSAGMASFNFNEIYQLGQAGVAVANIEATYGGSAGYGVVKVEQETTSEETVFI